MDYLDQKDIPAPTGRDNKVTGNIFFSDDPDILVIKNELNAMDRPSVVVENNQIKPLDEYK